MNIEEILKIEPYSLNRSEKKKIFNSFLTELSEYHYKHCQPYKKMMDSIGFDIQKTHLYTDVPFLPVQLFKTNKLTSISPEKNVRTLSSSGTTEQNKTRVYLDNENASNQTKVLAKIVSSFIGNKRMPMIIIDSESIVDDRANLSARAAGVVGFSFHSSKRVYVLNEKMELNMELLQAFLKQHEGERIFLFGFTFMVYKYFYQALLELKIKPDLSNAVLIHGGGWKKLKSQSVSAVDFRNMLHEICGITSIYDYYGMAEQTGSIFMECEFGHYHASVFSDIIIRRAQDFSMANIGEEGIIQVVSLLPKSYPGHSLLTDDKGILLGEDDCQCKRLGKYFKITGRLKNVELRGCSDVYEG
jgi:phenylacetate-coenzyme A ligase PaaK-like adenylate-forming protein